MPFLVIQSFILPGGEVAGEGDVLDLAPPEAVIATDLGQVVPYVPDPEPEPNPKKKG